MAVIKAKPEKFVPWFLGLMSRESVLPQLFTRVAQDFFDGALGDTVTMRINGGLKAQARDYTWRDRTAPIVMDDIVEEDGDGIPVKLDTHIYSATGLTDEQMRLDEINFATEVLNPQVAAVTDRETTKVQEALDAIVYKRSFGIDAGADPLRVVMEMDRLLDADKVAPKEGRYMLAGSNVVAAWTVTDRIAKYEWNGQEGTPALRNATLGQIAGHRLVTSPLLDPNHLSYQHPSQLVIGNAAPRVPSGAATGRTGISRNGFAVRWLQDYDVNFLRDRSVVSSFFGVTPIYDERDAQGKLLPLAQRTKSVRGLKVDFTGFSSILTASDKPKTV